MSVYDNLRLPDEEQSIRLLTIEPSLKPCTTVTCQLRVADFQHELRYEALSYRWDAGNETRITISVNGHDYSARHSLATALHALRYEHEPRTLWVDALCINQDDRVEKSSQVPLMGRIYRSCTSCIIWLGESDQDSRRALDAVRKGSTTYPPALSSILSRPWFSRIWIIQEAALAPTAYVHCGEDIVEWDQLAAVAALPSPLYQSIRHNPSSGEYEYNVPTYYPQILDLARKRIQSQKMYGLNEALRCFRPFHATFAEDKVYALLGLLEDPSIVQVNYKITPLKLYQQVARTILQYSNNLDLFLDCHQHVNGPRIPGLPSWAADWSTAEQHVDTPTDVMLAKEVFSASAAAPLRHHPHHTENILSLQAHFIGEILDLGNPIPAMHDLRRKYWPQGQSLPSPHILALPSELASLWSSFQAAICRRQPPNPPTPPPPSPPHTPQANPSSKQCTAAYNSPAAPTPTPLSTAPSRASSPRWNPSSACSASTPASSTPCRWLSLACSPSPTSCCALWSSALGWRAGVCVSVLRCRGWMLVSGRRRWAG